MTSKNKVKYRGSLLLNTVLSAAAALAAEVALLLNSKLADVILCQFGFQGSVASLSGEYNAPLIFVYLLIGICVFAFVFGMLQHRTLKYTRKISASLQEISEGHFNTRIPVRGDNELSDIAMQVNHMAEEIEQLLDRKPAALSGGQKQRVAIGSAIIRKPKAFLMDEPLSNLDAKLRAQMRVELVKLHKQLDTTIIYVTHDQTEAMTLGTKIVVMKDGLIQQVGAPQSIYDNPVNLFVAGFLGSPSMNFFRCTVKAEENNRTALLLDDAKTVKKVYLDGTRGKQIADRYNGRHVILGIRPEDIYELAEAKKLGIENKSVDVDEPVVNREMLGAEVILYFDEQGKTLAVRLSPENQTQVGEKVSLYFDMEKAHVFDPETEENIFVS